jgi:preprotein translocase subunit YajC
MGAIFMSVLVMVIAFVGGIYFMVQDRKKTHKQDKTEISDSH